MPLFGGAYGPSVGGYNGYEGSLGGSQPGGYQQPTTQNQNSNPTPVFTPPHPTNVLLWVVVGAIVLYLVN